MEDFYIKCKSEEESKLCKKWAIDNNFFRDVAYDFCNEFCYFIVRDNTYTVNDNETYDLPEKTLADLGINNTTEKDWSKVSKEELLEEAKRRYPVGTKFKCLVTGDEYVIPENVELKVDDFIRIYSYVNREIFHKHFDGNDNKWAEIISTPEVKETISDSKFTVGDWVIVLETDAFYSNSEKCAQQINSINLESALPYSLKFQNGSTNSYAYIRLATQEEIDSPTKPKEITEYAGLKIGDKLPEEIINKWRVCDDNYTSTTDTRWFRKLGGIGFISDRFIVSFKEINGFIGFLVSGTDNVYLKADGFKEFMDSYSRPINIQFIKTTSEQYDLSTTITRAVKNNDPSIIARETGKSIDELCDLVDEKTTYCLTAGDGTGCDRLCCYECQFSQEDGKTKESAKAWLRGKSKQSLSDYEAVHVDNQEKWDFVSEKLGYTNKWVSSSKWDYHKKDSCIGLKGVEFGTERVYKNVISFEDWLDLTGYRSEWDIFNTKTISVEDYIGTDLLIPKECSNPISQSSYPVITDPFAPIVELE